MKKKSIIVAILLLGVLLTTWIGWENIKSNRVTGKVISTATSQGLTTISAESLSVQKYSYRVINAFPHDPGAFTEGLLYDGGFFYESTGKYGQSSLRKVDIETGTVIKQIDLDKSFFGEGLTLFDNRLYQLTWKSKVGFAYDLENFRLINKFSYQTEGWGLTNDGRSLIMSDGTARLYFLDPDKENVISTLKVMENKKPVQMLNELEFYKGDLLANVWQTDKIARIDIKTGNVLAWIDLTGLSGENDSKKNIDVLNGIAYDSENDRLFVTGKYWSKVFQIELVRQ